MAIEACNHRPIIAIIGPTGTGKTKLGVAIASSLHSEVLSIDSLQCYRDGSIMTAKVTDDEAAGVRHHLVDYLPADEEPGDDFLRRAFAAIDDLHARHRVPVIVGGSTSLTLPLLFGNVAASGQRRYQLLVVVLWSAEKQLFPRLDARIDDMLARGLVDEVQELYKLEQALPLKSKSTSNTHDQHCTTTDTHTDSRERPFGVGAGVWKAIGYRELRPYIAAQAGCDNMSTSLGADLLASGVARMKEHTRKYATHQASWVAQTLVPECRRRRVPVAKLEVTVGARWEAEVERVAVGIGVAWMGMLGDLEWHGDGKERKWYYFLTRSARRTLDWASGDETRKRLFYRR